MSYLTPALRTRAALLPLLLYMCLQVVTAQTATKLKQEPVKPIPASATTGSWTSAPAVPALMPNLATAVLNGKLYAMGEGRTYVYDPATGWTSASLPTSQEFLGATALNGKIYTVGGVNFSLHNPFFSIRNDVNRYDPLTDSWSPAHVLSIARAHLAAVALNGKIYALGGLAAVGPPFRITPTPTNMVEVYDPTTDTWAAGPAMTMPRDGLAAVVFRGRIYALGGYNAGPYMNPFLIPGPCMNSVEVYDPATNAWVAGTPMLRPRCGFAAVVLNKKIYVFGGDAGPFRNTMEVYDPVTDRWAMLSPMPTPRGGFAASVLDGHIYAVGGGQESSSLTPPPTLIFPPVFKPHDLLISEFRERGPAGATDEFVELYNNTLLDITVAAPDGSGGWSLVSSDDPTTPKLIIPNGTTIPTRGHYLATGSAYSLGASAAGDAALAADIPDNAGLALFATTNPANFNTNNRLDAVGFSAVTDPLYREGIGLGDPVTTDAEHSFVRKLTSGFPQDTDNNLADFVLVATDSNTTLPSAQLGAPGPENSASPIQRNAFIKALLVNPGVASTQAPNRERNMTPVTNGALGTLSIRRRFINTTGAAITRLRFRIVDITTLNSPGGPQADLRALTSSDAMVSGGCCVLVRGLTLETPPNQPNGGGLNSTLSAGVITLGTPLGNNTFIDVQFVLGVQRGGNFRFAVNVEALP
jgi:N-acetylneuraminic acid mutarotase